MKRCPLCNARFTDRIDFCFDDGEVLVQEALDPLLRNGKDARGLPAATASLHDEHLDPPSAEVPITSEVAIAGARRRRTLIGRDSVPSLISTESPKATAPPTAVAPTLAPFDIADAIAAMASETPLLAETPGAVQRMEAPPLTLREDSLDAPLPSRLSGYRPTGGGVSSLPALDLPRSARLTPVPIFATQGVPAPLPEGPTTAPTPAPPSEAKAAASLPTPIQTGRMDFASEDLPTEVPYPDEGVRNGEGSDAETLDDDLGFADFGASGFGGTNDAATPGFELATDDNEPGTTSDKTLPWPWIFAAFGAAVVVVIAIVSAIAFHRAAPAGPAVADSLNTPSVNGPAAAVVPAPATATPTAIAPSAEPVPLPAATRPAEPTKKLKNGSTAPSTSIPVKGDKMTSGVPPKAVASTIPDGRAVPAAALTPGAVPNGKAVAQSDGNPWGVTVATPPKKGKVMVLMTGETAAPALSVDGQSRGKLPQQFELTEGTHQFVVSKADGSVIAIDKVVAFEGNKPTTINLKQ